MISLTLLSISSGDMAALIVQLGSNLNTRSPGDHLKISVKTAAQCVEHRAVTSHQQTAVHAQDLAGDVRSLRSSQKRHRVGHFVRSADPRQRDALEELRTLSLRQMFSGH